MWETCFLNRFYDEEFEDKVMEAIVEELEAKPEHSVVSVLVCPSKTVKYISEKKRKGERERQLVCSRACPVAISSGQENDENPGYH